LRKRGTIVGKPTDKAVSRATGATACYTAFTLRDCLLRTIVITRVFAVGKEEAHMQNDDHINSRGSNSSLLFRKMARAICVSRETHVARPFPTASCMPERTAISTIATGTLVSNIEWIP